MARRVGRPVPDPAPYPWRHSKLASRGAARPSHKNFAKIYIRTICTGRRARNAWTFSPSSATNAEAGHAST
jgi:hypothetical protein